MHYFAAKMHYFVFRKHLPAHEKQSAVTPRNVKYVNLP